jgi:putative membrane protein
MVKDSNTLLWVLGAIMVAAVVWSAINPPDYAVWAFELIPGSVATALLILTFKRFRFSSLAYILICGQFLVLATGAKYTYSDVPLFDWLQEQLHLRRNHFDRVGHFVQGFVPAIIVRELLLRLSPLQPGKWLFVIVISICLAFSAFYEIVEMLVVLVFYPDSGPEWLGMQGDPYDAQWDMVMAVVGATLAQLVLRRTHDRSIAAVIAHRART